MCLTPLNREILTAEEDIPVFKILRVTSNGYYSPVYSAKWEQGETKIVPDFSGKVPNSFHFGQQRNVWFNDQLPLFVDRIYHGLHSYHKVPLWTSEEDASVFKMTIPKGTKFIVGENGDLVSLALRFDRVSPALDAE